MQANILICDDDNNLRDTLRDLLEMEDYRVVEAASGEGAMQAVVSNSFDIILMDYNLADKTGIEVIHQIRQINQECQILMMTAHASLDTALKAIQESVADFLVKPVDIIYLKMAIHKALNKLQLERENKRLIADLTRANRQLVTFDSMKSKFLSMASHDLSNSLMTLQLSFEMLGASIQPSQTQKKNVDFIHSGIAQLSRLIEDLVDWAAIEQGKLRLEKGQVDLQKFLDEILPAPRLRAGHKNIALTAEVEASLPAVVADKRRLGQVLLNLLENAIRHTRRGGVIKIRAALHGKESVRVSVADTGEGIDPAEAEHLFESFYQAAKSDSPRGRMGLGLSIAKEILQGHGGKIWVESAGIGHGAVFHFTLPLRQTAAVIN
ncbi:MAG: hybrid sensor histidine kinase/response regulator [Elusimicrobia bacterium]|nr:hybrid sensor histidine kinase/response regulator [Elusimicrobiota bacterium]